MKTNQPKWKMIANLGDANPFEYGGFFVFIDVTGVYSPEAVKFDIDDNATDKTRIQAYRFSLDKLKRVSDVNTKKTVLVFDGLTNDSPHPIEDYDEWFHQLVDFKSMAEGLGITVEDFEEMFCSDDILDRACAYREIGENFGFENLDDYPLDVTLKELKKIYKRRFTNFKKASKQ
jgi:hypothetical protein